jgi:CheY-like chemotaxis protein
MKKLARRFETIPLAEVLEKTASVENDRTAVARTLISQGRENAEATGGTNGRVKRVMIVDDEQIIANTLAAIFRHHGYETMVAYDGTSGLKRYESFLPDLVVTDVVMPELNGIAMAIKIKQRNPDCRILLFSGTAATAPLLEEARRSGYDFELLAKPVHPADLLARAAA